MKPLPLDSPIHGPLLIEPVVHGDARGFFMETYRLDRFAELGIHDAFVQANHSRSARGVLRGLHYQRTHGQAKLVRVLRGCVLDVAVDLRRGSPTFGRSVAVELSEDNRRLFYVPRGFAHGFVVRSDLAEFAYQCSDYYTPAEERGLLWNDPALGIDWGLDPAVPPTLSEKDARSPRLADIAPDDLPRDVDPA